MAGGNGRGLASFDEKSVRCNSYDLKPTLPVKPRPGRLKRMRHIISILLQNEAGALARVANLFSSRGYNIESLNVAPTADETVSRLTLVTSGPDTVIDQISKQLGKLVDVVDIADMTSSDHIERELALFKLRVANGGGDKLAATLKQFDARVLNDQSGHYTVEVVGGSQEIDRFLKRVSTITDVLTVVRSGAMAVTRAASRGAPGQAGD
jgi:acetolactate synthase I/III small subunit